MDSKCNGVLKCDACGYVAPVILKGGSRDIEEGKIFRVNCCNCDKPRAEVFATLDAMILEEAEAMRVEFATAN